MLSVETLNVGFIHYISLLMELEYIAIYIKPELLEVFLGMIFIIFVPFVGDNKRKPRTDV